MALWNILTFHSFTCIHSPQWKAAAIQKDFATNVSLLVIHPTSTSSFDLSLILTQYPANELVSLKNIDHNENA